MPNIRHLKIAMIIMIKGVLRFLIEDTDNCIKKLSGKKIDH